jgi:prepilin-type processing-associated H-X9-DG protein
MDPQDDDGTLLLTLDEETSLDHTGGVHALLADGSVTFVNTFMPPGERRELLSVTKDQTGNGEADVETTP